MEKKELLINMNKTHTRLSKNTVLRNLMCAVVLFTSMLSYGQHYKWSLEGNFPFTFGDNFVDEGYNGVADLGLKYQFARFNTFDLGASLNLGAFLRDDNRFDGSPEVNGNAVLFQPRVFASFHIENQPRLHPMVGLGYSIFAFFINDQNFAGNDFQESASGDGINLNLAVAYDIYDHFYVQLQYDYVRLSARNTRKTPYNQNVNILKVGLGYKF
jgi:opacity protein-like surface antigen